MRAVIVTSIFALITMGCTGPRGSGSRKSQQGESCTKTGDCVASNVCLNQICVSTSTAGTNGTTDGSTTNRAVDAASAQQNSSDVTQNALSDSKVADGTDATDSVDSSNSADGADFTSTSDRTDASDATTSTDSTDSTDGPVIGAPTDTTSNDGEQETGPAESCAEAMKCNLGCKEDAECQDACLKGTDQSILDELKVAADCPKEKCDAPENKGEKYECYLNEELCWSNYQGCVFKNETGTANCADTYKCIANSCDEGDKKCANDCLRKATSDAQLNYMKFAACHEAHCDKYPNLSPADCLKEAQGICGQQYGYCLADAS